MSQEFGWSRTTFAAALTFGILCLGLPSPLIGILVSRFGARKMLFFGNLVFSICLAAMSQVREVWQVYLLYCIGGLGAGSGGFVPATTIANNWFVKKRALAFGITAGLMGLGGFIVPPLLSIFIESIGWRMSWVACSGMVFFFSSILGALIMVRNKPEDMGQVPDGIPREFRAESGIAINPAEAKLGEARWTIRTVMRQPATWLIAAFLITNSFVGGTMNSHQVAHMQDLGFSRLIAAMTVSVLSIATIVGNLGFGGLVAKINIRKLVSAAFAIRLIALIILLTSNSLAMLYTYAVLFGFSGALISTAATTLIGNYFGRARFPQIMGMIVVLMYIFLAAGPAFGGAVYDSTGNYTLAFIIMIAFNVVGLFCAFFARPPQPKMAAVSS